MNNPIKSISIRDLYSKILAFKGENFYELVLENWGYIYDYKIYLSSISNNIQPEKANLSIEECRELYVLSRVLDILTLQFQPNNRADGTDWIGPSLSVTEYIQFNNFIGLNTTTPKLFNTFDCEIIEVIEGDYNFQITECFFPAVKLKNLMVKRAGIKISLNPNDYNLNLINTASIYWAYRRKNRKYFDLSQGWGSNSQWQTSLRLDIETNSSFIYNQNGELNLNFPSKELIKSLTQQKLEIKEAIELTKYRHFVNSIKNDSDLFPFNFKYEENKNHP